MSGRSSKVIIVFLIIFLISIQTIRGDTVSDLNQVIVWTFNNWLIDELHVEAAAYITPQYCKRGWIKCWNVPWNVFADENLDFQRLPPLLNDYGVLFEGGVQVAQICPDAGWPCDNEYDDDHVYPFRIPDPVFDDFVTRNPEGTIYHQPSKGDIINNASIANENYRDNVLYWAYEQIDANVNALEFDEINGGYKLGIQGADINNSNTGYDDYAIGTANFATRLSVLCGHGMFDPISWFMPDASASSRVNPPKNAFDDDPETYWRSAISSSHWIEIDFGRLRTVQQIYLHLYPENLLKKFYIKYWDDTTGWTDFIPPINISGNIQTKRSFLVEPISTTKIRLFSSDDEVYLPEMQIFGEGFRQFLLRKYCVDEGWTPDDPRWESEKLVVLADLNQCSDGTMNTFNYRKYLQYHAWTENPFGGEITPDNYLEPPNPLFMEWFPYYYAIWLVWHFLADGEHVNYIQNIYLESYSYQRLYQSFWKSVHDSVLEYAKSQGKDIYITYNGSWLFPHYVDYMLFPMGNGGIFPDYKAPSPTDPDKTHLDGKQAQINQWRLIKKRATEYLGRDVPVVPFCDFWQLGMPYAHLGGIDEPADERAVYLRTFAMEMYAAGVYFCFPVLVCEENAWQDLMSNGTPLIEVIKQLADFLNSHKDIYKNVVVNGAEDRVTVNGVVPFNGEWNLVGGRLISPVNESKVTISYMNSEVEPKSFLHVINHDWDELNHVMIPQEDVPVQIPVEGTCTGVSIVSPDFPFFVIYPEFYCGDNNVSLTIPVLEYYAVIMLDIPWTPTPTYTFTATMTPTKTPTPSPTETPSPPFILTAGYMGTYISSQLGGTLEILAWCSSPNEIRIDEVEIYYEGIPTGFLIPAYVDETFWLPPTPMPPGGIPGSYLYEMVARDENVLKSTHWPYLKVN